MLLGASWSSLFPPTNSWTTEKSEQLAELGSKTNMLHFEVIAAKQNRQIHAGKNPAELQQQYDKVLAEYDVLHEEFLHARDSPKSLGSLFHWSGIALIAVGAVLTLIARGGD